MLTSIATHDLNPRSNEKQTWMGEIRLKAVSCTCEKVAKLSNFLKTHFILLLATLYIRVYVDKPQYAKERTQTKSWIKRMMARLCRAGTKVLSNNDHGASTWQRPSVSKTRKSPIRLELARQQRVLCTSLSERNQGETSLLAYWVLAMPVTAKAKPRQAVFDTDSSEIGVDNRCSACISSVIEDFEAPPIPCRRVIRGFGGTKTSNVMQGTLVWQWLDESGMMHKFRIPVVSAPNTPRKSSKIRATVV